MNSSRTAIAIDVGGTKIAAAVIDSNGDKSAFLKTSTPSTSDGVTATVADLVRALVEPASNEAELVGVGLSVAGTVDWQRGVVVQSPNLPFGNLALKDIIEKEFGLATFLDNDGNLATLGEKYFGAAKKARNVVGLTLGTGIGAGIIIENCLYRGATGSAAELGHMVIDAKGPQCTCGSYGCFEELASGRALVRVAKELAARERASNDGTCSRDSMIMTFAGGDIDAITGNMITESAYQGDTLAMECFKEIGYWLGIGLNNIVNIFNPEVIVIGGGMADASEHVFEPAREVVANRSLRPNRDTVSIVKAELGNDAGLFGAAALVFGESS